MNQEKIGMFIRNSRTRIGMTQEDLASTLYVSRQAVSKWEQGKSIPDSGILIEMSKLFGVTINEILAGEEKIPENENYIDNFSVCIIEDSKNKQKKIIKIFTCIILALCILFFLYYFLTTYGKIQVYYFSSDSNNFYMNQSLAFFSNEEIYIKFDDVQSKKDDYEINYVEVYYIKDGESNFVFSSDNLSGIVFQSKGYDEYFSFNDIDYLIDSLYADIHYYDNEKEEVETIEFTFERIYINNRLFSKILQKISYETINNYETKDVPSKILQSFDINDDGNYIYNYNVDDKEVTITYLVDSEIFWVVEVNDDFIKDFQFFESNGSYKYVLYDVASSLISESEYYETNINCITGDCNGDLEEYVYFIENYVNEYFD